MFAEVKRTNRSRRSRAGFTLVELLVVVVIIIILAGLLVPSVMYALSRARVARMSVEVSNLAKAIERYKIEFGAYPPDLSGNDADDKARIDAHLGRVFRYRNLTTDAPPNDLDPSEALYLWLRGFSPDPENPLTGAGDRIPFFDFKLEHIADTDSDSNVFEYSATDALNQPYIYFNNETYASASFTGASGTATPYKSDLSAVTYVDEQKYQIICPGQDGDYGANSTDKTYPSGVNYNPADLDNVTSFNDKGTLEDAVP